MPSSVYSAKTPSYCPTLKNSVIGTDERSTTVSARASPVPEPSLFGSFADDLRGKQNFQEVSESCFLLFVPPLLSMSWIPISGSTESLSSSDKTKSSFMPDAVGSSRAMPRIADRNCTRESTRASSLTRPERIGETSERMPASTVASVKPTRRKRSRTSRIENIIGSVGPVLPFLVMNFIPLSVTLRTLDKNVEPSKSFSKADNACRFA
mmetsp:Transcript_8538/g.20887  ORF Transcript_8538/g.20887 Transcript_8538/m.20887 type:complete len:209 (-) Transcript_8538:712-1338(-)